MPLKEAYKQSHLKFQTSMEKYCDLIHSMVVFQVKTNRLKFLIV